MLMLAPATVLLFVIFNVCIQYLEKGVGVQAVFSTIVDLGPRAYVGSSHRAPFRHHLAALHHASVEGALNPKPYALKPTPVKPVVVLVLLVLMLVQRPCVISVIILLPFITLRWKP